MKQIGIGMIQLPEMNDYKYLIVDNFTKWVETETLFDKTAKSVALLLCKQVCWHNSFYLKKYRTF